MSDPMTAAAQLKQFKKWDVPYKAYGNWETHNRNHKGKFDNVHGFMIHHTGSDSKDQRKLLRDGYQALPGPLAQWGLAQDGVVHLIGNGRCNHAGLGDPDVLRAVIRESYVSSPPSDNQATVDGNAEFYGLEIWHSGNKLMTAAQYRTMCRMGAATCDYHDWNAKSCISHGEWQPGKWDPGYAKGKMYNMVDIRKDIDAVLKAGPGPVIKPPVVVKPPVDKPVPVPVVPTLKMVLDNTEEILKLLRAK